VYNRNVTEAHYSLSEDIKEVRLTCRQTAERYKHGKCSAWQLENTPRQKPYLKPGGTNKPLDTTVRRIHLAAPIHTTHCNIQRTDSYLGGGGTPLGTLKHRPATQTTITAKLVPKLTS
jgi:hypothetical protein